MQRHAQGRLSFERAGARTVVAAAYAESPLRLLTPGNHGEAAWAYTSTLGGGLVDGDDVRLDVSVGEGARAFLSTQGPTRVYRSPGGCESSTSARVGANAALVLAPDPTACFAGARLRQRTELELAATASVAFCEVLSSGRSARGERWGFSRCSLGLRVRRDGESLCDETWLLDPAHGDLPERLGRFEALGTLLLCGPLFGPVLEALRDEIAARPVAGRATLVESASPLGDGALLVRLASSSLEALLLLLRSRLAPLAAWLGDDPWSRRS